MVLLNKYLILFFTLILFVSAQEQTELLDNNNSDKNLRLMYQVFTYSSDLNNSYKIAKKGVEKYPESLFWHRKLAKVAVWLDKRPEAIEQFIYIYSKTKEKKMGEKILAYALEFHQYEVAAPILKDRVFDDPSRKNIKDMIFVYDQVGTPEVSAETLIELSKREDAKPIWLLKAMEIYMQLGESELVEELALKIEKRPSLDRYTTQKLVSYYVSQQNIPKAYDLLLRVDIDSQDRKSSEYYRQVSDIGWYLQDPKNSAKASKQLFLQGKARLIDINRIVYYYSDLDSALVERATLYGSVKFKNRYLYSTYLNTLYKKKKYKKLALEFEKIERDRNHPELIKETYFWLMKAHTYSELGDRDKAIEAFDEALKLEHNSPEILSALMWFFIDHKEHERLKTLISELEESEDIAQVLWLPLAVGNFSLQKSDKSMLYIKRLIAAKDQDIDIKLMYAYIMQAREEKEAFMKMMHEVYSILNKRLAKNGKLMREKKFLEQYLSAASYFIDPDDYEELLEKSKSTLDKEKYIELTIYWALRHDEYALARYQAAKLSTVEPWMQLNIALNNDDRTKQLDLLYKYHRILPIRDRVQATINVGNIALGQTLAFRGMEENRYDYLLYQQNRDLIDRYADDINIQLGYQVFDTVGRSYIDIKNRYYIAEAWSLLTNIYLADDKNRDKLNQSNLLKYDNSVELGVKKEFDRGNFELLFGWRAAIVEFFNFSAKLHYKVMSKVDIDLAYYNNAKADETTYLLFGGKKDGVNAKVSLQYLPSSNLSLALYYNKYSSQDDYYLGDGYYARLEWYHQVHSGYPDIAIGAFADYGNYNDEFEKKFGKEFDDAIDDKFTVLGNLGLLVEYGGRILPEEFYNVGVSFFYGIMNKQYYTRVWRPYLEISPYYNGYTNRFNVSLGGGYGGSLYGQDHLTIGFDYDESVNGTDESNFKIYMNYRLFY